jgi:hypothetical protein
MGYTKKHRIVKNLMFFTLRNFLDSPAPAGLHKNHLYAERTLGISTL